MQTDKPTSPMALIELTTEVVAAYVANNAVQMNDVPGITAQVHAALGGLGVDKPAQASERPAPPVPVKKSITPDYLISLEDGRRYKSLKRHLSGRGLTPEQYRTKWGLPPDYPMVSANYAKQRSELAKAAGLGRTTSRTGTSRAAGASRKGSTKSPAKAEGSGARRKAA